jgi:exodeoxyribonuclease-1
MSQLLMHFKARNYPKSLTQDEQEDWFEVVQSRMQAGGNGYLSIDEYSKRVNAISYKLEQCALPLS